MSFEVNEVENLFDMAVPKGKLAVNWLGQAGFVLKTSAGSTICIDPYLTNSVEKYEGRDRRRLWFNSFRMDRFKPDVVICTHDHLDHTDPETIPLIAAYSNAVFYGTEQSYLHMSEMGIDKERLVKIETGTKYGHADAGFKPVYAKHTEDSIGVVLYMEGMRLYITGDTEYCDEILQNKAECPELVITCMNGKFGNMNEDEAVGLITQLGAKYAIPMHFGLLPFNTVEPDVFIKRCTEENIKCFLLQPEKNYFISKCGQDLLEMTDRF